ncbi:ABC transporter substrate-binding protein [Roseomonas sp. PWR1]|uniref:ABC transporter substrate-binding protein n=1 Tax=Roseomonas nitratireducens TaxID=2820810 RepID=A0ABS4APB3_9PROT|nr:ABC transporter substrate-binding protein [Neoroseomonas nitratireducens]MBP0463193.1 ABC transporter substrate-binding protein [Neoroseomonas nitratireducens]
MKRLLPAALAALIALPAAAQDRASLRIGVEAGPTSLDPHFASLITNIAYARHVFQPLVEQDHRQVLRPAIARSWRVVDETTWELEIDPDARFSDGRPVTAEDIAFTIARAGDVPNSPSSFRYATRPVAAVEAVGPRTVRLRTNGPFPLLLNQLALVMVVPKQDGLTTAAFNDGSAMIGSGPYRLVSWQPGQPVRYARNAAYAGPAPAHPTVEFRPIPNAGARVAALRSGDVDLIEIVPPDQFARLRSDPAFATAESPSNRLIFLTLDSGREDSPHVRVPEGSPLRNPLRDARVRRALSIAINREALVSRALQGQAVAAGDLGPAGYFGTSPDLAPPAFDLDAARRLLAEAGFPRGFAVQVNGPNDRYVNDEQVVQAIAQMWTRLGLAATVEVKPRGVWLTEAAQLRYSVNLAGFSPNPEVLGMLETQIHSWDTALGLGTANRGRFSDPGIDAIIQRARRTMDDRERERLTQEATRRALREETALIPLYFQVNTWAMRHGVTYQARTDEMTLAFSAGRGD